MLSANARRHTCGKRWEAVVQNSASRSMPRCAMRRLQLQQCLLLDLAHALARQLQPRGQRLRASPARGRAGRSGRPALRVRVRSVRQAAGEQIVAFMAQTLAERVHGVFVGDAVEQGFAGLVARAARPATPDARPAAAARVTSCAGRPRRRGDVLGADRVFAVAMLQRASLSSARRARSTWFSSRTTCTGSRTTRRLVHHRALDAPGGSTTTHRSKNGSRARARTCRWRASGRGCLPRSGRASGTPRPR